MEDWKELDINNLPSDILVKDRYEVEHYEPDYVGSNSEGFCTYDIDEDVEFIFGFLMKGDIGFRYRKRQPKAPSHEEIITKWWKDENLEWVKCVAFKKDVYVMGAGFIVVKGWFVGRKSADIPPEA